MGAMWTWLTDHWDEQWARFVEGILLLLLGIVVASVVRGALRKQLKRPHIDPQVALLVSRIAYLAVVLLGVIAFFTRWFGSPALVFGGFGFLALAFSLAFQDILKNFIAGMFLLVERPFRIGDEITVDNHTGVVENIEMRTTTLRTSDGEQVLTPNALVYTGTIINRTRYPTRLFTLTAKIPSGVVPDGLMERVEEQLKSRSDIVKDPPPHVGLQPSVDGGLTLEVRYWLDYRRNDPLAVQASVGRQIYQAIQSSTEPTSTGSARKAAGT
jgi:small conductance mechanosensitive channel